MEVDELVMKREEATKIAVHTKIIMTAMVVGAEIVREGLVESDNVKEIYLDQQ